MQRNGSGRRRKTLTRLAVAGAFLLIIAVNAGTGCAFDAGDAFAKESWIVSFQVGGGAQSFETHFSDFSNISFLEFMPRVSYLPFAPLGSSWYRVAVEPALEGWFEYYLNPKHAGAGGLKVALRLNAIGFGRLVPYLELAAGAGGTGLDVPESRSTFTFILEGGGGFFFFLKQDLAINIGYRVQHLSNGNTSRINRGYEANMGVIGLSLFLH